MTIIIKFYIYISLNFLLYRIDYWLVCVCIYIYIYTSRWPMQHIEKFDGKKYLYMIHV